MPKLILDYVYDHEKDQPDQVLLVQPTGSGHVIEYTWHQTLDQARRMATHLKRQGFEPGARIALLSKNCAHCFMAELAIWMAGGTTVSIYPTERADSIRYVLEHCNASLLFVGKLDTWHEQAIAVRAGLPCIALPQAPPTDFESWDSIIARTEPMPGRPTREVEDLAMLLYTSGSTGTSKGVMQDFGHITQVTQRNVENLRESMPIDVERRVLSYLPLAHAYERALIECFQLMEGAGRVFFSESLATFVDDIKRARPTIFCSVPRLWLKFQQSVFQTIPAATLDSMLEDPTAANAVGRKVLSALGLDQVHMAVSGSAPLPPALLLWFRRLGLNLLEGYAMTEDFCYSHFSDSASVAPGYVGRPRPGVQVRIDPNGEVLIKSPGQLVGYYRRPDMDNGCLTPTLKIKRSRIEENLAPQVENWYARPGPVLWA